MLLCTATCLGRAIFVLRVLPAGVATRATVGAESRSESTSCSGTWKGGSGAALLLRVVSELKKPHLEELKCGREE